MKKLFLTVGLCLWALCIYAVPTEITTAVDRLLARNGTTASGESESVGHWVVAVGSVAPKGFSEGEARTLAALKAREELARFLETRIASASKYEHSFADGKSKTSFNRWASEALSAHLKGVVIERTLLDGHRILAVAVMTERSIDATAKLQAAEMKTRPGTVEVTGEGETREMAVRAACRNALEQVCGVHLTATDISLNDKVRKSAFDNVNGLVSAYRILDEKHTENGWRIRLVAEISKEELLDNYSAQMKSMGAPVFCVMSNHPDAALGLSESLTQRGLKTSVQQAGADYRIDLRCTFTSITHPYTHKSGTRLALKATCYDRGGIQLFTLSNNTRKATSFLGDATRQQQICLEKADADLAELLHQRLQRAIADATNNGRIVRMVFRNTRTTDQCALLEHLTEYLNSEMPGVSAATYSHNDAVRVSTIRFNLIGNPQEFLNRLRKQFPDCPDALSVTVNKIVFEFY